jgi:hypothetical protein
MFPPKVRDDVEGLIFASGAGPVLQPQYQAAALVKVEYVKAMAQIDAWLARARAVH